MQHALLQRALLTNPGGGGGFDGVSHLGTHDAFHVSGPAILGGDHHTGRVAEAGADLHVLHVWVCQGPLPPVDHPLELLLRRARNNFGGQLAYSQGRVPVLFKARLLTAAGHQLQADCWQMQMQTLQATEVIHGC